MHAIFYLHTCTYIHICTKYTSERDNGAPSVHYVMSEKYAREKQNSDKIRGYGDRGKHTSHIHACTLYMYVYWTEPYT